VYERYRNGTNAATKFPVYSVTKSVIGMLVGIAVGSHEQDIGNAEQLLGDIMTAEVLAAEDQRVQEATLRDLLTMRAGWRDEPLPGGQGDQPHARARAGREVGVRQRVRPHHVRRHLAGHGFPDG
jgi:CubicO group peptidase (beta-lactamase class C family)